MKKKKQTKYNKEEVKINPVDEMMARKLGFDGIDFTNKDSIRFFIR